MFGTPSTAVKSRPKFFWKWSFFDKNQQPLNNVESFERILRALLVISQCPYKFTSFLDLRNASKRFRLFSRDFRLFRFFFPWSACFSSLASPRNLPSWVKYYGKFESFGKEFRWTKFIAVERVKGEPEPLVKESHEFLGSKRDDRFSNPFFEMVPKTFQGSFFVPALAW